MFLAESSIEQSAGKLTDAVIKLDPSVWLSSDVLQSKAGRAKTHG